MRPQNVLFSLPWLQQPASVLITVSKAEKVCSSTRRARRKFCWSYSVKVCSAAPLSRQRTDLALDFNNVWHFLRGRGRQNDILLRQTLGADGHPFTVEKERATSKCNLTSCKATGHLPCIFIDWNDWGQFAVLRGNTINYTPRCGG